MAPLQGQKAPRCTDLSPVVNFKSLPLVLLAQHSTESATAIQAGTPLWWGVNILFKSLVLRDKEKLMLEWQVFLARVTRHVPANPSWGRSLRFSSV